MKKNIEFIDREIELKQIQNLIEDPIFDFCIIFGRRRIGKTFLIKHAILKSKFIYYLARTENNLSIFYEECLAQIPELRDIQPNYNAILRFLKEKVDFVIFDEFQNMIKENEAILSEFNAIIELNFYKQNSKLNLIILGSSVSIIKAKVLDASKPLFGRATKILEIKPIPFKNFKQFFPKASIEELVEIYGFADGSPYYLEKIDKDKGFWSWLKNEVENSDSFLNHEITLIFEIEFVNSSQYLKIVKAIASGHTKLNEIAQEANMAPTTLPSYLNSLLEIGFIKKEYPITLKKDETKLSRYFLIDNFMRFWFTFIYPKLSSLAIGIFDINFIQEQYSNYLGLVFEDVAKQYLILQNNKMWKFDNIGRYWGKIRQKTEDGYRSGEIEIDLLGFKSDYSEILVVECKWSNNVNSMQLIPDLVEKSKHIIYPNKKKTVDQVLRYIFFAKSFYKKISKYESYDVICIDLQDLEKIMV